MLFEANGPHLCLLYVCFLFLSDVHIMDRNIRAVYLEVSCSVSVSVVHLRLVRLVVKRKDYYKLILGLLSLQFF